MLDMVSYLRRMMNPMDFWSVPVEEVSVTNVATNRALPDVVVAGLPAGVTVLRAVALFKFRIVAEASGAGNSLDGAQEIQVRDDTPGAWMDAINFVDDMFTLASDQREGGDAIIGAIDVSAVVDGNDTYNLQWENARANGTSINFNDVQVGLRIWFVS